MSLPIQARLQAKMIKSVHDYFRVGAQFYLSDALENQGSKNA